MGIGNQMFVYASLYGLARKTNKTAFMMDYNPFPIINDFMLTIPVAKMPKRRFYFVRFYINCLFIDFYFMSGSRELLLYVRREIDKTNIIS
jgi:hypothetical protein